jgi:hypothetical protein
MHHTLKHWVRLMTPMAAAAAMLALVSGQALAGHDGDRDDYGHHGGHHGGWGHHGWGGDGWRSGPNVGVYVGPAYPSYGYYAYPPYGYYAYRPYGYYGGYPY